MSCWWLVNTGLANGLANQSYFICIGAYMQWLQLQESNSEKYGKYNTDIEQHVNIATKIQYNKITGMFYMMHLI